MIKFEDNDQKDMELLKQIIDMKLGVCNSEKSKEFFDFIDLHEDCEYELWIVDEEISIQESGLGLWNWHVLMNNEEVDGIHSYGFILKGDLRFAKREAIIILGDGVDGDSDTLEKYQMKDSLEWKAARWEEGKLEPAYFNYGHDAIYAIYYSGIFVDDCPWNEFKINSKDKCVIVIYEPNNAAKERGLKGNPEDIMTILE